jgi:hypothetical protein
MTWMDVRAVGLIVAIFVTAVLWAVAFALGRVDIRVTARGLRNGALIAAVLFAITLVIVTFAFNGRAVFVDVLDLNGAFQLGVIVGAVVALGYLWLGTALIAIGLIFRSKPQWSTVGAWAAVPVIVVSLGFGYVSYRSVNAEGQTDPSANGTISMSLDMGQSEPLTATGAASCATSTSGTFTVHAGTDAEPQIVSDDGRVVSAQVVLVPGSQDAATTLHITGIDTSAMSTETAVGSGPQRGQIQLTSPGWSGTLTWSCDR